MKSVIDGKKAVSIQLNREGLRTTTVGDVQPVSNGERRKRFLKGCERMFASTEALKVLQRDHDELTAVEDRLAAKRVDHVGPAAAAAGKTLFKVLGPTCFNDARQAATWARERLPLSDAWRQVADDEDMLARERGELKALRGSFWQNAGDLALKIARHAGGSSDAAIDEISDLGKWL